MMSELYQNNITTKLAQTILTSLVDISPDHGQTTESILKSFAPAPEFKKGHLAYPCFPLAKTCKKSPVQIAQTLAEIVEKNSSNFLASLKAEGPYLNFFFKPDFLGEVLNAINKGEYFNQRLISSNEKWMIEYCQPNTHKVLHVGHMRNLCLGNALIRMCRYSGLDILAATYPGDVGTHVAKCLWYLNKHVEKPWPSENKGEWLGELYVKSNTLLEEEKGTDKEEQNRSELTTILQQLHAGEGEFYDIWRETRDWSLDMMNDVYKWADVEFDRWFYESEVDAPSISYINKLFEQGKLVKDDGAIGLSLEDEKLGFCLLVKSDGTGLYATKDVELARLKFEEFGIDHSIYIVDDRQSHHFKQVFKVLEKLGFEQAKKCFHLPYAMVELPGGGMSSRTGNIITLESLISSMEEKIKSDYLNKHLEDKDSGWTQKEVDTNASLIANAAIKYGMVRVDNNRKIMFDMEEALKLDGETGPYLQYVCARCRSLCEKLNFDKTKDVCWDELQMEQELALMVKLTSFNDVVLSSVNKLQTLHLCSYLYELGKLYNSFYAACPIKNDENEKRKHARMALSHAVGSVMEQGLNILGIKVPSKM
jgi:arginyl-tRNA synthetase